MREGAAGHWQKCMSRTDTGGLNTIMSWHASNWHSKYFSFCSLSLSLFFFRIQLFSCCGLGNATWYVEFVRTIALFRIWQLWALLLSFILNIRNVPTTWLDWIVATDETGCYLFAYSKLHVICCFFIFVQCWQVHTLLLHFCLRKILFTNRKYCDYKNRCTHRKIEHLSGNGQKTYEYADCQ